MAVNPSEAATPLLDALDGFVDYKSRPVTRSKSGGWRSAGFIIGVEMAERFAYYGISSNLISYMTGPLGQSTATAAENINAWTGTTLLLPLLGAFIADSFLGRFRTIIITSVLYIMGLGLLTLSAVLPSFSSSDCLGATSVGQCSPPHLQVVFFFFSLYLVAFAQGGRKPCVQAFGADQFDAQDPQECKAKSSFFNWWYFSMFFASSLSLLILSYIQDNISWGFGFGIPCIITAFGLIVFLLGTMTYRFSIKSDEQSAFARIGRVFVRAARNWRTALSAIDIEENSCGILPHQGSDKFKFLNKALLASEGFKEDGRVCSTNDIKEAKAVLSVFPIWMACLVYAVACSQSSTLFTKQGATMDRSIGAGLIIPAASLHTFTTFSIVIFLPIYDRMFVPIARAITHKPSGITTLQRIGFGVSLSVISMAIAALVERKRLEIALEYGLIDKPEAIVPMSFWWLVPQYILDGISDVFTLVGLQEFFYQQMPSDLKSVGLSLYLSIFGVGSFLSSFLISIVESTTCGDGQDSWFSDNMNRAHLDYFYWLLAGLSAVALVAYLYIAKSYTSYN